MKIELEGNGHGVWVKNWEDVFEAQKEEIEQIIQTYKKIIKNQVRLSDNTLVVPLPRR